MKNTILKSITAVMSTIWVLSILLIDSVSNVPLVMFWLSTAWLAYFGWCNGWFDDVRGERHVHNR